MIYNKESHELPVKQENNRTERIEQESRIVYLSDAISNDIATKLVRSLLVLDEINNEPIKLFINSPGGEINAGFFVFDCIKFLHSPVYTVGAGLVASAAAFIYLSVEKQHRLSFPHARYLLHQPLSGMRGVVTDIEIHARELETLKSLISDIIANETGRPIKKVKADTDRDFWLNADDAKSYGMVDTIIHNKKEMLTLFANAQGSITKDTVDTPAHDKNTSDKKKSVPKK